MIALFIGMARSCDEECVKRMASLAEDPMDFSNPISLIPVVEEALLDEPVLKKELLISRMLRRLR